MKLTEQEERELTHWSMWGSDGYPITKMGRQWWVRHFPVPFKTKREATAQWESYIDMLIERKRVESARWERYNADKKADRI